MVFKYSFRGRIIDQVDLNSLTDLMDKYKLTRLLTKINVMRKKLLLLMISFVLLPLGAFAQDTIPDLIFSEARFRQFPEIYLELCNVGDSALNLDQFLIENVQAGGEPLSFNEGTILEPGQTYVIANTFEEPDFGWQEIQKYADQLVYQWEFGELFDQGILTDSLSPYFNVTRPFGGKFGLTLWYKKTEDDSMIIDCFNWNKNEAGESVKVDGGLPIAGVVEPVTYYTIIRKSNVTQGNLGNWDASRGTDAADSEWLLARHLIPPALPFTTVGNHGNYSIDVTSNNPDITVDLDNGTLTLPWGIYRGDSLIKELNLGDGMAWWYIEKPVFEDSIHTIVQTGDTLQVKAFGTEMTVQNLAIAVSDPANDMNLVFPVRNVNYANPEEDPADTVTQIGGIRYYVTEDMPGMDTIGNVPFATRVDTLLKYLEWAANASVGIIWKDGSERVDLVNGDVLEVTAQNGDKKQYYIDVQEYVKSDNISLAAITWPDITPEDNWDYSWLSDTIPGFDPNIHQYNITLGYGSTHVPALKASTEDLNAKLEITPAISLHGGSEERTTVFRVISESDTLASEYTVTFSVYQPSENQQKFIADPFFSEFQHKFNTTSEFLEICNPGNQPLDLSRYLIVGGQAVSPAEAVTQTLDSANRYSMYVPGYRWADDASAWENEDYKMLKYDGSIDPVVEPNGGVFVIAARSLQKEMDRTDYFTPDLWDISFPDDMENKWGLTFGTNQVMITRQKDITVYLFRIDNDSILNGEKAIGDMNDLTLIDALGYPDGTEFWDIEGQDYTFKKLHRLIRKPYIWKGNPSYYESAGTSPEDCEWAWANAQEQGLDQQEFISTIGSHNLDPVTVFMSTVKSLVYIVDDGYVGDLGITGISNNETVEQFIANLILPDTGQTQIVKSGTDGTTLDPSDAVSAGDTLIVTSADETNTTKYVLDTTPLDDNTNLITMAGSSLTIAGGKVSGFTPGTKLEDILAGVDAESGLSIVNVIDTAGVYVPLHVVDFEGNKMPVIANSNMFVEVVAQNGDRQQYQLTPDSAPGDAYVLSNIYNVDQERLIISGIPVGTAVSAFQSNIVAAEGATASILDKADYERTLGNLSNDDVLEVVSGDESKTVVYALNFIDEVNREPSVTVESTDIEAVTGVATSVRANAEDDHLPFPPGELTYTWSVSNGEASNVTIANADQAETEVTFSAEGSYVLQVSVSDGELESVASVNVTVTATGIADTRTAIRMFPNPARESVVLELVNRGNKTPVVSVVSITGKTVYERTMQTNRMEINLNSMDRGLYFVKIETGAETIVKKLSIIR